MRIDHKADEDRFGGFTSMIDVVFLLLLFFILQPFKMPDARLDAPMNDVGPPDKPTSLLTIKLNVKGQGKQVRYVVGRTDLGAQSSRIAAAVFAAARSDTEMLVEVHADKGVQFGYVIKAFDACKAAGMRKVRFAAPQ